MDEITKWFNKNNPFKTDSTFKGKGHVLGAKDDEEKRKQNQQVSSASAASRQASASASRPFATTSPPSAASFQTGPAYFTGQGHKLGDGSSTASSTCRPRPQPSQTQASSSQGSRRTVSTSSSCTPPGAQQREDTNLAAARVKAEQHVGPEAAASLQQLLQRLLSSPNALSTCIPVSSFLLPRVLNLNVDSGLRRELCILEFGLSTLAASASAPAQVLRKLLNNAVNEPDNSKFQRIRLTNPKIQATVVEVCGGLEYLQAAGFELSFIDAADGEGAEGFAVLPDGRSAMPSLHAAVALLQAVPDPDTPPDGPKLQPRAASQTGPVPRMPQVLVPPEVDVSLLAPIPDSALQMSGAELKAEASSRRAKIEQSKQLTTRAYKEKLAAAKRIVHSVATVRIRLPDGIILQGCFGAGEEVSELFHFVTDALRLPLPFDLFEAAAKMPLTDKEAGRPRTFASASLVPSTLLYLKWSDKNDEEPVPVLRQELMQNAQPLNG